MQIALFVSTTPLPVYAQDQAAPASRAAAHGYTFSTLDLIVVPSIFEAIADHLSLDVDQRVAALKFHQAYLEQARALDETVTQRVNDAGLRQTEQLSQAARQRGKPQPLTEMKELRTAWEHEKIAGLKRSDGLLEQFYGNLEGLLHEDQHVQFEGVPALVRRLSARLRGAEDERHGAIWGEFSGVLDLGDILADAMKDHAEFENAPEDFRIGVYEVVYRYEDQMDAYRREDLTKRRTPLPPDEPLVYYRSDPRGQADIRSWRQRFKTLYAGVQDVAVEAENKFGVEKADLWRERFQRALAPSLFEKVWPDGMLEWLTSRQDVEPGQVDAGKPIVDAFRLQQSQLRAPAIRTGIELKGTLGDDVALQAARLRNGRALLAIRQLNERTVGSFRSLLTTEQAKDLDRDLESAKQVAPRVMGPNIERDILERLTNVHVARGKLVGPVDPETGAQIIIDLETQEVPWYDTDKE